VDVTGQNQDRGNDRFSEKTNTLEIDLLIFLWVVWDRVHLVRQPVIGLLYQLLMMDDNCGAVGVVRIGKEN
jgi:hypothetical protein